jgi:cob(I)alamin adenosyltransferase
VKIYTRKGDSGRTGIWGGRRLDKDDARVEAIGAVDECAAAIGVAVATDGLPARAAGILGPVLDALYVIGCELMAPDTTGPGASVPRLGAGETAGLEQTMDDLDAGLPELVSFIHPGGTMAAARLHVARTACRRAERRVTTLRRAEPVNAEVAAYLNRLSDLLFVLARFANHAAGVPDVVCAPPSAR